MIWEIDDKSETIEGLDEAGRPDPAYAAALGLLPAPLGRRHFQLRGSRLAPGEEVKALRQPVGAGDHRGQKQQQCKIAFDGAAIPGAHIGHKGGQNQCCQELHSFAFGFLSS